MDAIIEIITSLIGGEDAGEYVEIIKTIINYILELFTTAA